MTTTADIAAAVVADLNATAFSQSVAAERAYLPQFDLGDLTALRVTVVASGRTVQPASRSQLQVEHRIEIAVQRKLTGEDPAACDPFLALVGEIGDHLTGHRLVAVPDAAWVKTEHEPLVDPGHLNELRQFTSLITVTYRTWES